MKKIHYKNIGLPKTGTSWLWFQLCNHPKIDMFDHTKILPQKENGDWWPLKEQKFSSKEEYINFYSKYNISVNFDTWFLKDSYTNARSWQNEIVKESSHLSVSLRNPYDLLNSWYNFYDKKINTNYKNFLSLDNQTFSYLTDYRKMFSQLQMYKNKTKIKILFYDDLNEDCEGYLKNVCDFMGISYNYDPIIGTKVILPTLYSDQLTIDDEKITMHINENICRVEDFTQRDLSHWKKNT